MKNPILLIYGPIGSGKGTQSELLVKAFGVIHISLGDLLREEIAKNSEQAAEIKKSMDKGELVSFDIVDEIVRKRLELPDVENGIVFDGYPRAIEQAKTLIKMLKKKGKKITKVISIKLGIDEIMQRLSTRLICLNCRAIYNTQSDPPKIDGICDKCGNPLTKRADDQQKETINERMKVYWEETVPVLQFFDEMKLVEEFDGPLEIEELHDKIYVSLSM